MMITDSVIIPLEDETQERSDFICIECGEELGPDDTCADEECPLFDAEDVVQG